MGSGTVSLSDSSIGWPGCGRFCASASLEAELTLQATSHLPRMSPTLTYLVLISLNRARDALSFRW